MNVSMLIDANTPSLETVIERLANHPEPTPKAYAAIRSAGNTLARLLGKPLSEVPAHAGYLNRQLQRLKKRQAELQPHAFSNLKYNINLAVRLGVGRRGRSELAPLSNDWRGLKAKLSGTLAWKLPRFIAFLSASGIAPDAVRQQHLDDFAAALATADDLDDIRAHYRAAIKAWNRAVSEIAGWPQVILVLPPQRRARWTIEEEKFTDSFRADVDAFFNRDQRTNMFGLKLKARQRRPATYRHRRHETFKAASALVLSGTDIGSLRTLADLVSPEPLVQALGYLVERNGGETSEALHHLATGLKSIAEHHLGMAGEELATIGLICADLDPGRKQMGERTYSRLQPFEDDVVLGKLLHLSERLLLEARNPRLNLRKRAVLAQTAIATEIESYAPIRLKNLAALQVGKQIRPIIRGNQRVWLINLAAEETKNRRPYAVELPARSTKLIEAAMTLYPQPDGRLFPGRKGGPRWTEGLGRMLKQTIEARIGVDFNVHLFRSLAVTIHLSVYPTDFAGAAAILGDTDLKIVAERYGLFAKRHLQRQVQSAVLETKVRTATLVPLPKKKYGGNGR